MTPEIVIDLLRQGTSLLLVLVSLLILPSLIVGLFISVFQAATQINEQSLSFVPRLIVTFTTLIIAAPWLIRVITDFTQNIIESIPQLIG
ncbi:flagellar biosynthesis protein FliQ [Candidatus Berkiella aquae]|uniref:Flagellar biosynthetic protein FliQ n=2 Tax=Candidatus Berkiella aquae TaxID=295108 RepID=A0A0Q9YNI9_9GAMM|nr:flagellar biosynthesis protein FliQ [Candidatus Berkiella aquae]MCS5711412.1 flagellar biosynthesis protein FliQ [Candidatus Berkiella aquae]